MPKGEQRTGAEGEITFLDHASGSLMSQPVVDALVTWVNRGNASADYASAREGRAMMDALRALIGRECGFRVHAKKAPDGAAATDGAGSDDESDAKPGKPMTPPKKPKGPWLPRAEWLRQTRAKAAGQAPKDEYVVVFTSGATESNALILQASVRAHLQANRQLPHLVVTAAEHASVLATAAQLAAEGRCQLTILPLEVAGERLGAVDPARLDAAIRPNTCLVSVAAAFAETGVVNDLRRLASVAHRRGVPFHTDAAQVFGRVGFAPRPLGVDAWSASFHKLGGPPGVGVLVVRARLLLGYGLRALQPGTQNYGLRGGTENLPGLGASMVAFRLATAGRAAKSTATRRLRDAAKGALATRLACFDLEDHPGDPLSPLALKHTHRALTIARNRGTSACAAAIARADRTGVPAVFWIGPRDARRVLPGTLLLAVRRPGFDGAAARQALERRGVIVATGSACGLGRRGTCPAGLPIPLALRGCVLRVSLGDATTTDQVKTFVRAFLAVVGSTECLSDAARTVYRAAQTPEEAAGMVVHAREAACARHREIRLALEGAHAPRPSTHPDPTGSKDGERKPRTPTKRDSAESERPRSKSRGASSSSSHASPSRKSPGRSTASSSRSPGRPTASSRKSSPARKSSPSRSSKK